MKAVLLLALVAFATARVQVSEFKSWADANGKKYTASEFIRRMAIYSRNVERVAELNEIHEGAATFAINKFADLTPEEFATKYLGSRPTNSSRRLGKVAVGALPESLDWRTVTPARVNPVTDQASCGSCWAFSATVFLENVDAANTGSLKKLSEQQLVDCDHECREEDPTSCDGGCNGGWMVTAMTYAIKNGMELLADYPYKARDGKCAYDQAKVAATFTGKSVELKSGDEAGLQQHCNDDGPISVAVNANPFQFYSGGIILKNCPGGESYINHGVAAVGWGKDASTGVKYWIVRNSWGKNWGEKGYCRVKLGENMCGIASHATLIIA